MKFDKIFKKYVESTKPVKTLIHWYDLYGGHYVNLDKNFQKIIFEKAIKKAGNYSELGRILKIGGHTISKCYKGKINPQIKTLKKIAKYINYPLKDINNKIIKIVGLKPKFPFNLNNKEGAEIRAAFLSDGHIDKVPINQSQYCAFEKELHKRLINLCKNIFGEFKTKTYFNNKTYVTKFPAVIGRALELSGVPKGDKRLSNFNLPKDILLGDEKMQTSYLRRVFDDEGDLCFDNHGKRAVRIGRSIDIGNLNVDITSEKWIRYDLPENIKHNLLIGEQLLLLKLGIDARLYSEGIYKSKTGNITAKWRIQIGQQDQLRRFSEIINFNLNVKKEKLNKTLNSYQYRKLPNGKGKKEAQEFIKKVFKKQGFIKFKDLGDELVRTGRSYDLAGAYLKYFLDKNLIDKIERGKYVLKC